MADKGDVNLKHLSGSTDGMPIVITGTAVASPTVVHTSPSGTDEVDRVTLLLCNTDAGSLTAGVVIYTGTPADPTHVVAKVTLTANSGAWVVLDGVSVGNGKIVGVYCGTASKITAFGWAARNTL